MNLTNIQKLLLAEIVAKFNRAVKLELKYGAKSVEYLKRHGISVVLILADLNLDARPLRALARKGAIRLYIKGRKISPEASFYVREVDVAPTAAGRKAI